MAIASERVLRSNVATEVTDATPQSMTAESWAPRIPAPYRAVLAICSDLDETPDKEVYYETMKFLNTSEDTRMGKGVNLEVGNTIYFNMPAGQFSYWNTDDAGREMVHQLIRSGHIDALHSFGDFAVTRADVEKALAALTANECFLKVWIDHAVAPTNFGADIMRGHGDDKGHSAYHADLTLKYGIKYVWRGRVTSVIGQEKPISLGGVFESRHPLASGKTLFKEGVKRTLAQFGNVKYSMQRHNRLCEEKTLRTGDRVIEFIRCNPHWGGVSSCDTGYGIADVLTRRFLDRLVEREGWSIVYTHLGKLSSDSPRGFNAATVAAFRRLAEYQSSGQILVTTTRRLLDYATWPKSSPQGPTWEKLSFPLF